MSNVARPASEVPAEARAGAGFDAAESAGLFVGVSHFEDPGLAEIPFAVDDAVDLAHLFALELRLILPEKLVVAASGDPRKPESAERLEDLLDAGAELSTARPRDIYDHLERRGRACGPRGLLVVSLATHGFSDQGSDFLLGTDSFRRRIVRTGVSVDEVFEDVASARTPRRLVLLDACRERLSTGTRKASADPEAAMSRSFADAITSASGQVVLAGTTHGGFAYDDFDHGNGVFSLALMDGLRGAATVDPRGFITVRTLADYVQERVVSWVHDRRPEHAEVSRGISRTLEGAADDLPLAVDPAHQQAASSWRQRRDAALERLRENLGDVLSGSLYDGVKSMLTSDGPRTDLDEVLEEIEALDGSARSQRSLAYYLQVFQADPVATEPEPPAETPPREELRAGERWRDPILGAEWVAVPPGRFWMGSPASEAARRGNERRHRVTLTRGFQMTTTPVTKAQYATFVAETGHRTEVKDEADWRAAGGDHHPVVFVSWNDARAFCQWLGQRIGGLVRLPTEAEWEFAARAGTETATYAGDLANGDDVSPVLEDIAWYWGNTEEGQAFHPVALKAANPWGLYDMLGSVWEWVEDSASDNREVVTGTYEDDVVDPLGQSGASRVARGGSRLTLAPACRAAMRVAGDPDGLSQERGFRAVRIA